MTAAQRWAAALQGWGIPQEIIDQAPESPWQIPPEVLGSLPVTPTPTTEIAREALPDGGTVLDVGAGTGLTSLPLSEGASLIVAVDDSDEMLAHFARNARDRGVEHREIRGWWPDVAPSTPRCDVVVCGHVLYNIGNVGDFAIALTEHAARRVVVEMTDRHPRADEAPLWKRFWNVERPDGPTVDDAIAALEEAGIKPERRGWMRRPWLASLREETKVPFVRMLMCLHPEHDTQIEDAIREHGLMDPRPVTTLWWDV